MEPENLQTNESKTETPEILALKEAYQQLLAWGLEFKTILLAEKSETVSSVPAGLDQLIENLRQAIENAKEVGENVGDFELTLKLLDAEENLRDKAVTLAGLEM
jgi:hypothetical protein